jgi:hypothetical protein
VQLPEDLHQLSVDPLVDLRVLGHRQLIELD